MDALKLFYGGWCLKIGIVISNSIRKSLIAIEKHNLEKQIKLIIQCSLFNVPMLLFSLCSYIRPLEYNDTILLCN